MGTSDLPTVIPDREPLTEAEAMKVGDAVYRLTGFRRLLKEAQKPTSGTITVGAAGQWVMPPSVNVSSRDLEVIFALLIEREELFLASFNVRVEKEHEPKHDVHPRG